MLFPGVECGMIAEELQVLIVAEDQQLRLIEDQLGMVRQRMMVRPIVPGQTLVHQGSISLSFH